MGKLGADKRGSTVTWRLRAGKNRVFDTPPGDAQPPPAHPPSPTQILPKDREGDLESVSGGGFAPTTQTVVIPLSFGRIWVGLWSVRKDYGLL